MEKLKNPIRLNLGTNLNSNLQSIKSKTEIQQSNLFISDNELQKQFETQKNENVFQQSLKKSTNEKSKLDKNLILIDKFS